MEDKIKIDIKEVWCGLCTAFISLRTGPLFGFCEHNNEPSNLITATDETITLYPNAPRLWVKL